MSTLTDFSVNAWQKSVVTSEAEGPEGSLATRTNHAWSEQDFAEEQLRNLVRQLFLPGWPTPMRQVVFCPVESEANVLAICTKLARTLAAQTTGTVRVVNAAAESGCRSPNHGTASSQHRRLGNLRDLSWQLSDRIWIMPRTVFLNRSEGATLVGMRARLAELRLEFDYTIVCGPPASISDDGELIASLCESAVLVLQANSTRRIAAQKVIQRLRAVNVRIAGTVLSERQFPVQTQSIDACERSLRRE